MKTLVLSTVGIDARLKEIEDERSALLALRRVYQPDDEQTAVARPAAIVKSRTPTAPKVRQPLIIPTGATPAILQTVDAQPGIHLGDLIDAVLKKVPPTGQLKPRKNIANIIGQLVVKGRLLKKPNGGFHLPKEDVAG